MDIEPDFTALITKAKARRGYPTPGELQALRVQAGLSQQEIADALGVDRTAVIRWEQGVTPRGENRARVASLVRVLRAAVK